MHDPLRPHLEVMPPIFRARIRHAFEPLDHATWHFDSRNGLLFALRRWPRIAVDTVVLMFTPEATYVRRDISHGSDDIVTPLAEQGPVEQMVTKILALGEPAPGERPA